MTKMLILRLYASEFFSEGAQGHVVKLQRRGEREEIKSSISCVF
jgi:hypothetical protein